MTPLGGALDTLNDVLGMGRSSGIRAARRLEISCGIENQFSRIKYKKCQSYKSKNLIAELNTDTITEKKMPNTIRIGFHTNKNFSSRVLDSNRFQNRGSVVGDGDTRLHSTATYTHQNFVHALRTES